MAHSHRLAAKLGIVALLDQGREGIHVDMDDLADAVKNGIFVRVCPALARPTWSSR